MLRSLDEKLGTLAARAVAASVRRPGLVLALVATVTPALGFYTVKTLGVNADMASLVSNELPHRILELDYQRAFPFLYENIVVVVDAPTPEESSVAAATLAEAMERDGEHFRHVFYPGGEFFERHALLYANPKDLERFADRLTRVQPYLSTLAEDGTLRGLSMMMTRGLAAIRHGEFQGDELGAMLERTSEALRALEKGEPYRLSWTEIVAGGDGIGMPTTGDRHEAGGATAARRRVIMAQPVLDLSRVLAAEQPIERVRELARSLDSSRIRVRITGDMALSYEELSIVKLQTVLASVASFFIVAATMILAFRSVRMTLLASLNMLVGLVWTLAFATVAVGHLNMISVAFVVLFIGLSDDYGIHFCMRYRELLRAGRAHAAALEATARDAGASICICAVTTAIGFYAFVPTDFRGVAELGLISGTGMFINVFLCFTLLPAMVTVAMRGRASSEANGVPATRLGTVSFPVRYPRSVGTVTVLAALAAAMLVPRAYFDGNPLNVRDPTAESVKAFQDLLGDGRGTPWNMSVVVDDRGEAQALIDRLRELPAVRSAITVEDFVPKEQDEKLAILNDLTFFLPPSGRSSGDLRPPTAEEQLVAIRDLRAELDKVAADKDRGELTAQSRALRGDLDRWLASLGEPAATMADIATLEASLLATLPHQLATLERALRPGRVTLDALPRAIVDRMVAADGRLRVEIAPTKDLTDEAALVEFVESVRRETPNAAGGAIGVYEGKRAVVIAFQEAFAMAVIAIALLLLVIWRTVGDTILVMTPLALAALFTTALAVMLGIPFNFADVIVLPLLFGLGVNSGIHLVERWRLGDTTVGQLLETSTAQAVVYSSLNTIGSFGTLGFTTHRGMASMGQLLALGVALTVICNLFVLPALIELRTRHSRRNTTGTANT
jgi:hopanoid biosynthesis associated RND transporter like protein HpnN